MLTHSFVAQSSFSSATVLRNTLRAAVDDSQLSKQDIASRAGISRRALYSLLEGEADPRLSTIEALSHVLGLEVFAAPKALNTVQLSTASSGNLSIHSRVRRLLQRSGHGTQS